MVIRVGDKLVCGALMLSLLGGLPGCSFLFTTAPKSAPSHEGATSEYEPSHCTTSQAAPIVDTVIAGLEGVRTGLALAADKSDYANSPISKEADIAFGLGFLALFSASAIYGFYVTGECSKLHHHDAVVEKRRVSEDRETGDPNDLPPRGPAPPPSPAIPGRPSAIPQQRTDR
ncbi:MAG TPA: hypothetical protein VHM25_19405 [Polyangiaceae bacterium]|jgi:hypothetical protein|nr:hypothetical protein [Polyangiaceae bacterium]